MSSIIFFYTENRPKGKKQKRNVQKNDSHDEHSDHINILGNDRELVDQIVLNLQDGDSKPENEKEKRGVHGITKKNDNDKSKRFNGIFLASAIYLFSILMFILCYIINVLVYKFTN